ncbi:helix-turn-helix domain-containing protein [Cellulomonas sp. URHD0024]|uniref:winged helix-turn-helix transcriptional regulator n=1 Tax=Cellulomonas sp. URHD0024 TaxID=1302620 RepID=UPI0003FEEB7B|nr:helix-turn-helix domain-containing protein [Cellulomonas sp. URHD0024]
MDTVPDCVPYDVLDVACPSRMVLARVGEKWTVRILLSLDRSVLRFTELRGLLTDITPKVLTETLRALERDGLVARQVFAEVPPRVEYRLTPLGTSLLDAVQTLRSWSEANAAQIVEARARADARALV